MKTYRLKKSLHIFRHVLKLYRRKKSCLPEGERAEIVHTLDELQQGILDKNREKASTFAQKAETLEILHMKKSPIRRVIDFIVGLGLALLVAVLIRTMWFELYEIPTGSMRPTFAEGDRLVVSKTTYGINIPLKQGHFYFDPDLVQRNGTVVFTGAGMDIRDIDTMYFYLFPGKKQFVKRLIGKPGDLLYFYGGKIYGIDKDGNDITKELNPEFLSRIDHVPYIHFNGKMELPGKGVGGIYSPATLKQMNQPVARLSVTPTNKVMGEMLPPFMVNDYYDLWGFKDYGMGRLLTQEQVKAYTDTPLSQLGKAPLYMEIVHHPTIKHPKLLQGGRGEIFPSVGTTSSVIPLSEEHLKALMDNIYTSRFIVKNGKASRYGSTYKADKNCQVCPDLPGIPDGTYEFYYGKGYQVRFGKVVTELPKDHPLYDMTPERIQLLYNMGMEFMTFFAPYAKDQGNLPSRYVYYRDGDLYTMGAPFIMKDDSTLSKFVHQEYLRQANAPSYRPHIPFDDPGPPLTENGSIDIALLERQGLSIPPNHYLALGDNYANSGDSREFGFVPEDNIRGTPYMIFWPPGPRLGPALEVKYPFFNTPRSIVWVLAIIGFGTYYIIQQKRYNPPQKIE